MNILIYHFGALGDFITMLPVTAALKKHAGTTITLLGKPVFGTLGHNAGYIDSTIDADAASRQFLHVPGPPMGDLIRFYAPFTTAIFFAAPDAPLVANGRSVPGLQVISQPPFPQKPGMHIVDYHLSVLGSTGVAAAAPFPSINPAPRFTDACIRSYGIGDRPYIVINPGSGSTRKNWPFVNYLTLAEQLRHRYGIVWLVGPAEADIRTPSGDISINTPPLTECAALLARCAVYIGNDSGITHLAAATGCPVVALFGPSDPAIWGPRGDHIAIIHHPQSCACAPCHPGSSVRSDCGHICMRDIGVDEVMDEITVVTGPGTR